MPAFSMRFSNAVLVVAVALLLPSALAARDLLQTQAATAAPTCPIDSSVVTLNFTEVKTACVSSAATPTNRAFCDACTCALFSAFSPALEASGVISPSNQSAVASGVAVVSACVNSFLAQFVAAKVDIPALVDLANCEYKANEVPACLSSRVAALTSTTNGTTTFRASNPTTTATTNATTPTTGATTPVTANTTSTITQSPAVQASSGPTPDYAPDSGAPSEISAAINREGDLVNPANPTTTPTASPAVTTPVPTDNISPATTSPATTPTTTAPEASPATTPEQSPAVNPVAVTLTPTPTTELPPATTTTSPAVTTPVAAPTASPVPSPTGAGGMAHTSLAQIIGALVAASMLLSVLS